MQTETRTTNKKPKPVKTNGSTGDKPEPVKPCQTAVEVKEEKKIYEVPYNLSKPYQVLAKHKVDPDVIVELCESMKDFIEMPLQYQPQILQPPQTPQQLYSQACGSDNITINTWRCIWLENIRCNIEKYGKPSKNSIKKLFQSHVGKPGIIAGSGPSLKKNAHLLTSRLGFPLTSCLHNFGYFEDIGVKPDYYLTLDAGKIVISETYEGSKKYSRDELFERTKDHKLLAYIGTDPELLARWKGEIIWFNAPVPDEKFKEESREIINDDEFFGNLISSGGNALGACMYATKAILGCNPIVFVGADFSFSYDSKFHAWDSQYDSMGGKMLAIDVYGNKISTWPSYYNFKCFFDYVALSVPGDYVNATEGGILGAYHTGNITAIKQMPLSEVYKAYNLSNDIGEALMTVKKDENGKPVLKVLY